MSVTQKVPVRDTRDNIATRNVHIHIKTAERNIKACCDGGDRSLNRRHDGHLAQIRKEDTISYENGNITLNRNLETN